MKNFRNTYLTLVTRDDFQEQKTSPSLGALGGLSYCGAERESRVWPDKGLERASVPGFFTILSSAEILPKRSPSLALNGCNCSRELWCANDAMKKKSNDETRKRIVKQESVASLGSELD